MALSQPSVQRIGLNQRFAPELAPEPIAELPTVSVIGLGYVGVVSVGCLAARGFRVIGADVDAAKVTAVAAGASPIVEKGLESLLTDGVRDRRITATSNIAEAVRTSTVTVLAVGTPTAADGGCDLSYVRAASRAIGEAICGKPEFHCVVLRCSVPPGTTMGVVVPEIEASSGKTLGHEFGVCFSPEFLREGSAVADFADPAKIVLAASDARAEMLARQVVGVPGQRTHVTTMAAAETLKYVDNVWHAAKVVFANEVGRFCKPLGVDSHEVMRLFVQDTKLNLSPYYLKPGFAFGGSCLPKEVRAAVHIGTEAGVALPLMESLLASNARQIGEAERLILATGGKTIGLLGLTFKSGTDDLRESPMMTLMARLIAAGLRVRVLDPSLSIGPRLGAQLRAIRNSDGSLAPALDALQVGGVLTGATEVLRECDTLVVAHATDQFRDVVKRRRADVHVVDLARLFKDVPDDETYCGIAW